MSGHRSAYGLYRTPYNGLPSPFSLAPYNVRCYDNLAPLCRHHHRCKQAEGWWLEQPEPGVLVWHTPAGRTYTTTPTQYAI